MNPFRLFDPFAGFVAFLQGPRLCIFGSKSSASLSNNQTSFDASATGAGAATFTASQSGRQQFDLSTGQSTGASKTGNVTGSENLILGTGADYTNVETLSDDVVARALETVDSTTSGAFTFADSAVSRAATALQGSVAISDAAARRSADLADASRLTLERIADPAGSASRTILYVVAALAAVALFIFRPLKSAKA